MSYTTLTTFSLVLAQPQIRIRIPNPRVLIATLIHQPAVRTLTLLTLLTRQTIQTSQGQGSGFANARNEIVQVLKRRAVGGNRTKVPYSYLSTVNFVFVDFSCKCRALLKNVLNGTRSFII